MIVRITTAASDFGDHTYDIECRNMEHAARIAAAIANAGPHRVVHDSRVCHRICNATGTLATCTKL